ncbi:MAG: hypothetical protein Q9187_005377 [Circinaria calcarea]
MEKAAKRKDATKPKAMTQADRMAEAARTEKKNARSLNRWEETERKRAEDQKARLAALHNRQLQGPFIRWWSGPSKWVNGNLVHIGVEKSEDGHHITVVDPRKGTDKGQEVVLDTLPSTNDRIQAADSDTRMPDAPPLQIPTSESARATPTGSSSLPSLVYSAPLIRGPDFLDGVYNHSTLPEYRAQSTSATEAYTSQFPGNALPPPPVTEYLSRNLVILENIDPNAVRIPELQNHVLLAKGKKVTGKLPSKTPKPTVELCAITGQPARFRDPRTGLAYANSYAYKEIQKLRNGGSRWSNLLGCYVGSASTAARGVPERFLRQDA